MHARIVCTRITPRSFLFFVTSTLRVPSWAMSFATRSMPSFASTDTKFGVMMSCSRTSAGFHPGATTEDVPLRHDADGRPFGRHDDRKPVPPRGHGFRGRSEEHTSELQSLAYLVCRLLLEKKNNAAPTCRPLSALGTGRR